MKTALMLVVGAAVGTLVALVLTVRGLFSRIVALEHGAAGV